MSNIDQCPSTESKTSAKPLRAEDVTPRDISAATGKAFWRSVDDLVGTREFKDFVQREFPAFASELLDGSRRHFMRVMGASLALAGVATLPGCRRPDHKILAYAKDPEHVIPGKPLYYATSMPLPGGGAEGLLAETFEGRPVKLEGNPLHSFNNGSSGVRSQASVLDLYNPDRAPNAEIQIAGEDGEALPEVKTMGTAEFGRAAKGLFEPYTATSGAGLAFLVEKSTSPSRNSLKSRITSRFPKAAWHEYEASDDDSGIEGSRIAFGAPHHEAPSLDKAKVVVSFDRDFLGVDGNVAEQRAFSRARYTPGPGGRAAGSSMSRLYVAESAMTLTGGQADHRVAMAPSKVVAMLAAVASGLEIGNVGMRGPLTQIASGAHLSATEEKWLTGVVADLKSHRGESVVLGGRTLPAGARALIHAINAALGNAGKTVRYTPMQGATTSESAIRSLSASIDAGSVETLVIIGCNPVYDAPGDLNFAEKLAPDKIRHTIHLGDRCETAAACEHHVRRSHFLEAWGDTISADGAYSVTQPMIKPLFDTMSDLELLALAAGDTSDGYEIVRRTMREVVSPAGDFENAWRRALHDGVASKPVASFTTPAARDAQIAQSLADWRASAEHKAAGEGAIEVVFRPCAKVHDGRFADNAWLQELPDPITKVTWDNPMLVSLATAKKLGLKTDRHLRGPQYNYVDVATVTVDGRSVDVPVWVQPGLADDCAVLTLGYGRTVSGRVAFKTGADVYPLRGEGSWSVAHGASVKRAGKSSYMIANTQDHWAIEGRGLLREVDLAAWHKYGDQRDEHSVDAYGRERDLSFGQKLGIESHAPANVNSYNQKGDGGITGLADEIVYWEADEHGNPKRDARGRIIGRQNKYGRPIQQWGMSIDLTKCTGCGACTVACQAENNIPVVGKMEVARGREMHWIRVDRYYASEKMDDSAFANPDMGVQPVPCMQCENAPCEVVCPVNATTHSKEGTNDMAYNRCIGTRYCSNNCPYKVRRFNYFDYATKEFKGRYAGQTVIEGIAEPNPAMVPPRLREKISEVRTMQYNPHVSVRSRGVMEKCTYCIQRVNQARVETKIDGFERIPDGFVSTACQQACPSEAIIFGDIYDHDANNGAGSLVSQAKRDGRTYEMLGFLNARPRTTYMVRLRNPNPMVRKPNDEPFHHGAHEGGHDEPHNDPNKHDDATHGEGHVMRLPVLNNRTGVMA
ncbi:MAG: TAT-variant-translocated molybdopterin oxidoreductase [Phycisphaerales bacterium]|nr:TAT-variant-translocated molybdopterin oxidoreductase [Phycisphaerales bacterium]